MKTIIEMAREAGGGLSCIAEPLEHPWKFSQDELEQFAELVRADERERIFAEQLQSPEPRLTGKFSITAGKFKCTGCTSIWTNREDAKHHSCKDYQ